MKKKYIRNIIFTRTPLTGVFRYKDEFQVYPLNKKNAPYSSKGPEFPVIIEYSYDKNDIKSIEAFDDEAVDKKMAETTLQTNKLIQLTDLLSAITNHRFFFYRHPEKKWALPIPEKFDDSNREQLNNSSSTKAILIYYYPNIGADMQISRLSTPLISAIPQIEPRKYYYFNPVESVNKVITFPNNIHKVLGKYYCLNAKEHKIVSSAVYQICNGLDLQKNMKSLSFFSFVSSIETLITHEYQGEKLEFACKECQTLKSSPRVCRKCGSPKWGIAEKFREFLLKYVSSAEGARKMYSKIYSIRSKISHTEYLINGENFLNWDFDDKSQEVSMKHLEVVQLSRRSLVNWLLKKDEP
ncbi:MAG: hypothetical protein ACRBFS_12190 [Aureispira sp.]